MEERPFTRCQESWSDDVYGNTKRKNIPFDSHTSQDPWGLRNEKEYKEEHHPAHVPCYMCIRIFI
jgi:hypothetical protein